MKNYGAATYAKKIALAQQNVERAKSEFLKSANTYAENPTPENFMELTQAAYKVNFHADGVKEWIELRDCKD